MRADRVKPGHIVKDDEGIWQVVVDRRGPDCLVYANGHEEWGQIDDDVEVASRLSDRQIARLHAARQGRLFVSWPQIRPFDKLWREVGAERQPSVSEMHRLEILGLIETETAVTRGTEEPVRVWPTPSGRALLEILTEEPSRAR